jgi:ribosome-interacting GTPase 1
VFSLRAFWGVGVVVVAFVRSCVRSLASAWVWGSSVKHQPQKVGKDHLLEDEDVVQIVKK